MSEQNGCTHVNTHMERRGDYSCIVCDACGTVTSQVYDPD